MSAVTRSAATIAMVRTAVCCVASLAVSCFSITRYATLPICTAERATRKTPPAMPAPMASHTRIAPSIDIRGLCAGRTPLPRTAGVSARQRVRYLARCPGAHRHPRGSGSERGGAHGAAGWRRRAGARREGRGRLGLWAAVRALSRHDVPILPRADRRGVRRRRPHGGRVHPRDGGAPPLRGPWPAVRRVPLPHRAERLDRPGPPAAAGHVDRRPHRAPGVGPERRGRGHAFHRADRPGVRPLPDKRGVPRSTTSAICGGIPGGRRRSPYRSERGRGPHAAAPRSRAAPQGAGEDRRAADARSLGRIGGRAVTDEKLASALGVMRTARVSEAASARVREQLEQRWRDRAQARRFALPWFVPSLATVLLVVAVGAATLRAGADSALYGARVAIEDSLVALHTDLDDRLDYIRELYDERTEEAARAEAVGNALAAGRARAAQEDALRLLNATSPKTEDPVPPLTPEPNASAPALVPSPTETPAPSPTVAPSRAPTPRPTVAPTAKPTPLPTPTTFLVTVRGGIVNPDGSPANDVCVSTSAVATAVTSPTPLTTTGCFMTATGGTLTAKISAKRGQTVTLYFSRYDVAAGKTLHGYATFTVTASNVSLGIVQLGFYPLLP